VPYAGAATHVYRASDLSLLSAFAAEPVPSVDASRRLAHVTGDGTPAAAPLLGVRATVGTAAFLCGLARRQVDITVAYLKDRKQFGVAIGTFQGLKHPLAAAVVDAEFAWPVVLNAAHTLTRRDVSHAKAAASDAAYRMSRVCLQAHGAMGYTVEYDLHLFMKRTWALAKDWGTADEHRAMIAREIL
jgi:alkylation response protein AidB-like acyl-CoA dehydrogenase